MKSLKLGLLVMTGSVLGILSVPFLAGAQGKSSKFEASLRGYSEVPAVSSTGRGEFTATISKDQTMIEYELSYENLEGTVTNAAHIHLGQPDVNGGVSVFLCGGGGKPACPPSSGTVTGTILASDVGGPVAQGIAPGELAELLQAIRAGVTYANVHTNKHPSGEIRGAIEDD
jgi:hypothetical protein